MNHRVLQIRIEDIIISAEKTAQCLTDACNRGPIPLQVTGVCQIAGWVIFPLEPVAEDQRVQYVLAPFVSLDPDAAVCELQSRWQGGFVTRGLIPLPDGITVLGLFEQAAD